MLQVEAVVIPHCKPLIRKDYQSFAKKCAQNVVTRRAMVNTIGRILTDEVQAMCSQKFDSILRRKCKESLVKFQFETIISEPQCQASSSSKTKTPRSNYS